MHNYSFADGTLVLNERTSHCCGMPVGQCNCDDAVHNIQPLGLPSWEDHFVNNKDETEEAEQEEVRVRNRTDINGKPCLGLPDWDTLMQAGGGEPKRVENKRRGANSRKASLAPGQPGWKPTPLGTPSWD